MQQLLHWKPDEKKLKDKDSRRKLKKALSNVMSNAAKKLNPGGALSAQAFGSIAVGLCELTAKTVGKAFATADKAKEIEALAFYVW